MEQIMKADYLIIGLGAAGGVLFGKLAEAGKDVVALEAGPMWTEKDFVSDEREMVKLRWQDPRISEGEDPIQIGITTSGKGVGGGSLHYTMMSLRLHPSDFKTFTNDGVGVDWPIGYDDLEPYYTEVEYDLPVSGSDDFPWQEHSKPYPMRAHKMSCIDELFAKGAEKAGARVFPCPLALITQAQADREVCINRGFCEYGCKPRAKSSTLVNYIPRGIKAGGRIITEAMAVNINLDHDGKKAISVDYIKDGTRQTINCENLILAAFTIEIPRLLLASRTETHPRGVANSSGQVGLNLMCHTDHVVSGRFDFPVRPYRNPPITSITQDFYETDAKNDYKRGFSIAPYASLPIGFALLSIAGDDECWGEELHARMEEYNFWMQLGIIGEVLPYPENRVELSDENDQNGMPIPKAIFRLGANEKKMIEAGYKKMEEIMKAAGAIETFRTPFFVHLMGTTRMGDDPATSVVDADLKAHDLDNLYICGPSVYPTSGAVNPTLTAQALAARLADHLTNLQK